MLTCRTNRSKAWEKKQIRPYPDGANTWKGPVFVVQCFFGFAQLETPAAASTSQEHFGLYLPDDAIEAVREWLDTVKFTKAAQVRIVLFLFSLLCLSAIYNFTFRVF